MHLIIAEELLILSTMTYYLNVREARCVHLVQ
jgi:hypothetical protein